MSRGRTPVVDFPVVNAGGELAQIADILRAALGRLTSLVAMPLLLDVGGVAFVALGGAGSTVSGVRGAADLADATVDQVRVVVYGQTSAGAATVQIYDVTNSRVLCSVGITNALAINVGAWTRVSPIAGDAELSVRVIGDGAATQTLHNVTLQGRTSRFQQ